MSGEMEEQPVPRDDRPCWPTAPWAFRLDAATTFGSIHIAHGVRRCCAQCGETISADKIACVVTLRRGHQWHGLHFHRACYAAWERMENSPPTALSDKVVALSALRQPARRDDTEEQKTPGA